MRVKRGCLDACRLMRLPLRYQGRILINMPVQNELRAHSRYESKVPTWATSALGACRCAILGVGLSGPSPLRVLLLQDQGSPNRALWLLATPYLRHATRSHVHCIHDASSSSSRWTNGPGPERIESSFYDSRQMNRSQRPYLQTCKKSL